MQVVVAAPIEALCWQPDGAAGVRRHATLAEASYYFRHRPCAMDIAELEPWAMQYPPLKDNCLQRSPQVACYELRDACVTSQGCVITRDGHAVQESFGSLLDVEGLRLSGLRPLDDTRRRFERDMQPGRTVAAPSLLLKRAWWNNFFHWLLEAAAPLALMRLRGLLREDLRLVMGPYRDPVMVAAVAATLQTLWPWPSPLVEEQWDDEMVQYDRLYYITPVHPSFMQVPETVAALRSYLVPPPGPRGPKRIYIERTGATRQLSNQDAVLALCRRYGCEPVRPVEYSLLEQVRLFRDAELIVGVKGADFANAFFCAPWASLVLLSPADFPDPTFWDIAGQGPLNYFELFGALTASGDRTGRNPFAVSTARLEAFLDIACAPPRPGSPRNRRDRGMGYWMHHGYMPWLDGVV